MDQVPTYHDVLVICEGVQYQVNKDYRLELTCTKVGGWNLWRKSLNSQEQPQLIGGEFHGPPFRIEINGIVICDSEHGRQ